MAKKHLKLRRRWAEARSIWDESAFRTATELPRLYKFAHFCLMVWRSFSRNRCPVRASALAYGSLLALIPMLAVVMSITSTFLKKEGEKRIDQFIVKMVATLTPPGSFETNTNETTGETSKEPTSPGSSNTTEEVSTPASGVPQTHGGSQSSASLSNALPAFAQETKAVQARKDIARRINQFIQNTRSGALGVTGSVLLIFAAISMLSRIEDTFNDIWGVARGRNWFMRIVFYWGVITLAPLLIAVAVGLAGGSHLQSARNLINNNPILSRIVFQVVPAMVLCFTFAVLYMLMPNTKVRWRAALAGGLVGGLLFHINNLLSVFYVSRVVSYSKIYGGLGLVPVFMVGLYLSWWILLLGAQVSYAYQNRSSYLEAKQIENINQRGREFIALRIMTCIGLRFEECETPLGINEIGKEICVPTRLLQQIVPTLCAARMVVEVAGNEAAYVPARPLESISCYDILQAMRASQGQELATRDEPTRVEVFGEFSRIEAAERQAGSSVSLLALVHRARAQLRLLPDGTNQCEADEFQKK